MTASPQSLVSPHSSSSQRDILDIPARVHQQPSSCHIPTSELPILSRRMHSAAADTRSLSEGRPCSRKPSSSGTWHEYKSLPPLCTASEYERQPDLWTSKPGFSLSRPTSTIPQHMDTNQLQLQFDATSDSPSPPRLHYNTEARMHSAHFPADHHLNAQFVATYQLEDELGSGGYGFVMTAYHRTQGHEVAVKFIIKDKVPEHAWTEDEVVGRLPTEVVILTYINHDSIVKCLDLFEDSLYFYLVQELHGSPWVTQHKLSSIQLPCQSRPASALSTPSLSPSSSEASLPASEPSTPPHMFATIQPHIVTCHNNSKTAPDQDIPNLLHSQLSLSAHTRPGVSRRPSHDLFECIEQSEDKRLTEAQARYVFSQVVDAVHYLDTHGIAHRDIKDENLVIDKNLKIKLIDFGSSTIVNPAEPRPYYNMFYGTAAYASSEILLKKSYQAAPAEVWTLGVLLSYLLAGISPFPTARDAVDGHIFISEKVAGKISDPAMDLMKRCLDRNPDTRATISEMKAHPWLKISQALL